LYLQLHYAVEKHFQDGASTQRSLHYAPPDFLSNPVALMKFVQLSLRRAAFVVVAGSARQEIRVRFGRDDKE
jgi:hypothetical protein